MAYDLVQGTLAPVCYLRVSMAQVIQHKKKLLARISRIRMRGFSKVSQSLGFLE
jgi:hypothetical protein